MGSDNNSLATAHLNTRLIRPTRRLMTPRLIPRVDHGLAYRFELEWGALHGLKLPEEFA